MPTPEARKRAQRARQRSFRALARRYPGVYREILEVERAKEGIRTLRDRPLPNGDVS